MVAYNIHKSWVIVRSSAGGPSVSVLTVGRKACLMDRPRIDCITDNDPWGNGLKAWDINRKSSMSASVAKGISMNNLFFCVCTTTHTHACTHTLRNRFYTCSKDLSPMVCAERSLINGSAVSTAIPYSGCTVSQWRARRGLKNTLRKNV